MPNQTEKRSSEYYRVEERVIAALGNLERAKDQDPAAASILENIEADLDRLVAMPGFEFRGRSRIEGPDDLRDILRTLYDKYGESYLTKPNEPLEVRLTDLEQRASRLEAAAAPGYLEVASNIASFLISRRRFVAGGGFVAGALALGGLLLQYQNNSQQRREIDFLQTQHSQMVGLMKEELEFIERQTLAAERGVEIDEEELMRTKLEITQAKAGVVAKADQPGRPFGQGKEEPGAIGWVALLTSMLALMIAFWKSPLFSSRQIAHKGDAPRPELAAESLPASSKAQSGGSTAASTEFAAPSSDFEVLHPEQEDRDSPALSLMATPASKVVEYFSEERHRNHRMGERADEVRAFVEQNQITIHDMIMFFYIARAAQLGYGVRKINITKYMRALGYQEPSISLCFKALENRKFIGEHDGRRQTYCSIYSKGISVLEADQDQTLALAGVFNELDRHLGVSD